MDITRFAVLVLFIGLICTPAMADTKYLSGGPDITAAVAGTNEFSPGQETTIRVSIENRGLIDIKFVQSGIVERDDLPNTARLVRATLVPGDVPVTIKSDPQLAGDILGGKSVVVPFVVKFDPDAPAGDYTLPLAIHYTYLRSAEQHGQDAISYYYKDVEETISLPIRIKPEAFLSVESLLTEHLNAGNEGYLSLRIQNTGYVDAGSAIVRIARNGASPVIPTDSSIYIGDFPVGATVDARFKVSVSREAGNQSYPLDLFLVYEDGSGDQGNSRVLTIGVPVEGKIGFSIARDPEPLRPGARQVIEVEYRNMGPAPAYNAQARISAVDPFTSNDDTAFLGDLDPGEAALARFIVTVDAAATPKDYGLDSEIRYRDALGNSQISDSMKVKVTVLESSDIFPFIGILVLIVAAAGAGYYFFRVRKRE